MKKRPFLSPADFASGFGKALPAYPVLFVLLGGFYFGALRTGFNYTIGHFDPTLLFGLMTAAVILGILLAAVPAILTKHAVSLTDTPQDNLLSLFASVMGAVLAVILAVSSALAFTPDTSVTAKLETFTLPFLAVSLILPFFLKKHPIRQICASISVLTVNLTMFGCYFDPNIAINSPVRNLTVILQAAVILLLLSEARLAFGTESFRITSPFYLFANGAAAVLGGGLSLGGLLNRFLTDNPADPNLPALRLGLYLALALLALSRLFALPKLCGPYIEPPKKEKEKDKDKEKDESENPQPEQ